MHREIVVIEGDKNGIKANPPSRPIGQHPDGSLSLCPDAAAIIRTMMLHRGSGPGRLCPHDFHADVEKLADVMWEKQGIEFEQYT